MYNLDDQQLQFKLAPLVLKTYLARICYLDDGYCHIQLLARAWVMALLQGLLPDSQALSVLSHSRLHIA